MKKILAIVTISILSTLALSLESKAKGYLTAKNKPCKVWYGGVSKPNISVTWTGSCSANGKATGKGTLVLFENGEVIEHHEGILSEGKYHGKGITTWPNDTKTTRYDGNYKNDQKDGFGTFSWYDGSRYEGEWRSDERHGFGITKMPSGSSLIPYYHLRGIWVNGFYHAQGLYQNNSYVLNCPDKKLCDTSPLKQIIKSQIKNSLNMNFNKLPIGSFMMGGGNESNEHPKHLVKITKPFFIQTTEVTQGQWEAIMGPGSAINKFGKDPNLPISDVSWVMVQKFIQELNKRGDGKYRLPTEAEWEYAVRGQEGDDYYMYVDGIQTSASYAWFKLNSQGRVHPVASLRANSWGLFDMKGNLWELVNDWYGPYSGGTQINPLGPKTGTERVVRGGDYLHPPIRNTLRGSVLPNQARSNTGFRLVRF